MRLNVIVSGNLCGSGESPGDVSRHLWAAPVVRRVLL